jgi:hypothetical protein
MENYAEELVAYHADLCYICGMPATHFEIEAVGFLSMCGNNYHESDDEQENCEQCNQEEE